MRKNRLVALALAVTVSLTTFFAGCGKSSSNETDASNQTNAGDSGAEVTIPVADYEVEDKSPDGPILQCFCWSFNTINESMEDIYNAGYAAIQTSPINECIVGGNGGMELMGQGKWYYHYQPTDWTIGNYQLGTKEEFAAMVQTAHEYGIKVIVDVVPNHTTGDTDAVSENLINAVGGIENLYHTTGSKLIANYADRKQCTLYSLTGLADVNTENPDFQDYFIEYLNECIALGVDGFRYDTAKHIGLPDDPMDEGVTANNFWKRVITEIDNADSIFNYGEVLQGDGERVKDYITAIGATTASTFGANVRSCLNMKKFLLDYFEEDGAYNVGEGIDSVVTWVESHDNYTGEESTNLTDEDIKLGWAFICARAGGTPLFFSRPYGSTKENMWGTMNRIGTTGNYNYKDATVAAANKFNTAMQGESEKISNLGDDKSVAIVERGTRGLTAINLSTDDKGLNVAVNLEDGTYINRVDGITEYIVADGLLTGTLPARSAVILYNEGYVDSGIIPEVKVSDDTQIVYYTDSTTVTLNATNTESSTYSLNGADEVAYVDGTVLEISPVSADDNTSTLVLRGTSTDGNSTIMTYVFTHKSGIAAGTTVYFQKPDGWGDSINAYVYDESSTEVRQNKFWPGAAMTDEGNGLYSYTFEEDWEFALIIFNDGSNQYPGTMEPGLEIEAEKIYTKE